jgi:hypothetical protein
MLDDGRPIMDGRWGDESEFQDHKAFEVERERSVRMKRVKTGRANDVYMPRLKVHMLPRDSNPSSPVKDED